MGVTAEELRLEEARDQAIGYAKEPSEAHAAVVAGGPEDSALVMRPAIAGMRRSQQYYVYGSRLLGPGPCLDAPVPGHHAFNVTADGLTSAAAG